MFNQVGVPLIKDVILVIFLVCCIVLSLRIHFVKIRTKKALMDNQALIEEAKNSSEEAIKEARAKTEFVANMSHEIRTPMNAICCATELLAKEDLTASQKSYLSILKSSSDNLLDMVNDILDFSKMDAGKMSLIESEYNLSTMLEDVKNIISVRLSDKPIAFTIDLDPTLPNDLIGDEVRIKQILINLLGNAVKYTTRGEINLDITYERLSKDSIDLTFSVKDTGCGIPPTEKEKLFKKFEQADQANHRYTEGTGLGLSICKQLATMMGGTIAFESELSKGSTFMATVRQKISKDSSPVSQNGAGRYFSLDFCVWEDNLYYKENILRILAALGIPAKSVDHISELEGVISSVKIDYILTTEKHFAETVNLINKISPTTIPVKLVELGEPADTSFDGNFRTIRRPVDAFEVIKVLEAKEFKNKHVAEHSGKLMAPDASLLLVDDNRVNLKVAKALMETFSAKVVAVDSGYEAVEFIRMGERFDLIFMDHMMPGMDGIETASKIWQIQGENKTPIIALTANAGGEVEKLFFEAGMSDFIPKPIVMKHLNFVMQKWLPKEKQIFSQTVEQKLSRREDRMHSKPFQPDWGLSKVWNDDKIYLEILKMYKEKSPKLLDSLDKEKDMEVAAGIARELSTISASAGAARLPDMLTELINLGRIGESSVYRARLDKIIEEYKLLNAEISKYLETEGADDILTIEF